MTYSAFAGIFLGLQTDSAAQLIHTEIDPDETRDLDFPGFEIDFDHDGINELNFNLDHLDFIYHTDSYGATFHIIEDILMVFPADHVALIAEEDFYYIPEPLALESGYFISEDANWVLDDPQILFDVAWGDLWFGHGNFWNDDPQFIGVRFFDHSNYHYAWVRLSVEYDEPAYTIFDYAYHPISTRGINTGDTGAHLEELKCFYSDHRFYIFIPAWMVNEKAVVEIFNMNGYLMYQNTTIDNPSLQISIPEIVPGIYIVRVGNSKVSYNVKVVVGY